MVFSIFFGEIIVWIVSEKDIMETLVIEDNLDKECHALGSLFQHIINEMKVRTEMFLELFFYRYI